MSAYQDTDKELKRMEKFLSKQFRDAEKEIKRKASEYLKKFDKMDKEKQQQVLDGKLTREEYARWREGKIMFGAHWENLLSKIQNELLNVTETATGYVNGKVPEIFAVHYNDVAMQINNSNVAGVSFEMVNSDTIKNLAMQKGVMLPPPKLLDKLKQTTWNKKKINAAVLQGILQGESMDKIANRISSVAIMNKKAAIRNARTMVTAAENSGRQSGLNRAEERGIIFDKLWIATLDGGTRDTHMKLNGETVPNKEMFVTKNGELEFPGDWRAPACEVYNCRCSLGSVVKGFKKVRDAELDKAIKKCRTRYEAEKNSAKREQIICEAGELIRNELTGAYNKYIQATTKKEAEENAKKLKQLARETLKSLRKCGTETPEKFAVPVDQIGASIHACTLVRQALSYYPTDWIDATLSNGRDALKCGIDPQRGYFNYYKRELFLSPNYEDRMLTTAFHELGHNMEHDVPNVLEAQREFYNRRTKGEKLVPLGGAYKPTEMTRRDNFINAYMGKFYPSGKSYELVSMGFQSYFNQTEELFKDSDYANFIMGVLALC